MGMTLDDVRCRLSELGTYDSVRDVKIVHAKLTQLMKEYRQCQEGKFEAVRYECEKCGHAPTKTIVLGSDGGWLFLLPEWGQVMRQHGKALSALDEARRAEIEARKGQK